MTHPTITLEHLISLYDSEPGSALYVGPSRQLFIGPSQEGDASSEYEDIITRSELIEKVDELQRHGPANSYVLQVIANTINGLTKLASAAPETDSITEAGVQRFHAVIAGSQPPSMEVIAGGPKEWCIQALENRLAEHPLGEYEDGLVLETVHHVAPGPFFTPREALAALATEIASDGIEDQAAFKAATTSIADALTKLENIETAYSAGSNEEEIAEAVGSILRK